MSKHQILTNERLDKLEIAFVLLLNELRASKAINASACDMLEAMVVNRTTSEALENGKD
jgi:hypothetical protein